MIKIDWTKPVRHVRDHMPVRVLCTDADDIIGQPVVVLLPGTGLYRCQADGDKHERFENVPETTVKFLNVYSKMAGSYHAAVHDACMVPGAENAVGTLQLTFENDKLVGVEIVK